VQREGHREARADARRAAPRAPRRRGHGRARGDRDGAHRAPSRGRIRDNPAPAPSSPTPSPASPLKPATPAIAPAMTMAPTIVMARMPTLDAARIPVARAHPADRRSHDDAAQRDEGTHVRVPMSAIGGGVPRVEHTPSRRRPARPPPSTARRTPAPVVVCDPWPTASSPRDPRDAVAASRHERSRVSP
jgi:hypothetical protein